MFVTLADTPMLSTNLLMGWVIAEDIDLDPPTVTSPSYRFIPANNPLSTEPPAVALVGSTFNAAPTVGTPDTAPPVLANVSAVVDAAPPAISTIGAVVEPYSGGGALDLTPIAGSWSFADSQSAAPTGVFSNWELVSVPIASEAYTVNFDMVITAADDSVYHNVFYRWQDSQNNLFIAINRTGIRLRAFESGVLKNLGFSALPSTLAVGQSVAVQINVVSRNSTQMLFDGVQVFSGGADKFRTNSRFGFQLESATLTASNIVVS